MQLLLPSSHTHSLLHRMKHGGNMQSIPDKAMHLFPAALSVDLSRTWEHWARTGGPHSSQPAGVQIGPGICATGRNSSFNSACDPRDLQLLGPRALGCRVEH